MTDPEITLLVTSLFERWHHSLLLFAIQAPLKYEAAEDLVQDTFLQLYRALRSGKQVEHPKAWTLCVLRRAITQNLRKEARYEPLEIRDQVFDSQNNLCDAILFRSLMDRLSGREKQVLLLRLDSWKYLEIADQMSISVNTVHTLIGRALRKLRMRVSPGSAA
jgi:RNA polymerase sigma-70 factor (ECF subfamily)